MGKAKVILVTVLGTILGIILVFFLIGYFKPKKATLLIQSTPDSSVFINEAASGQTPFKQNLDPDEISIRLVPMDSSFPQYETKVSLRPGITTVVRRNFGPTEEESSGEIISFEKDTATSLSIVSSPDSAQVSLDGQAKGFTPQKISKLTPGSHQLKVLATGYVEKSFSVQAVEGHKLTITVKLAQIPKAKEESQVAGQATEVQEVEILPTPTGFLRVRENFSTQSREVGQVRPGEKYALLEENPENGWFKIELQDGSFGWISGEFARKVP